MNNDTKGDNNSNSDITGAPTIAPGVGYGALGEGRQDPTAPEAAYSNRDIDDEEADIPQAEKDASAIIGVLEEESDDEDAKDVEDGDSGSTTAENSPYANSASKIKDVIDNLFSSDGVSDDIQSILKNLKFISNDAFKSDAAYRKIYLEYIFDLLEFLQVDWFGNGLSYGNMRPFVVYITSGNPIFVDPKRSRLITSAGLNTYRYGKTDRKLNTIKWMVNYLKKMNFPKITLQGSGCIGNYFKSVYARENGSFYGKEFTKASVNPHFII